MFDISEIFASDWVDSLRRLLSFFSMIFLIGIVMLVPKYADAERRRRESLLPTRATEAQASFHPERWDIVEGHLESGNPAEWRVAIIEADNILADALKHIGFGDMPLGEVLKRLDRSDLRTLEDAWEAHRVRNKIAHEGSKFILTEYEARRVVGLYENVFRELEYV